MEASFVRAAYLALVLPLFVPGCGPSTPVLLVHVSGSDEAARTLDVTAAVNGTHTSGTPVQVRRPFEQFRLRLPPALRGTVRVHFGADPGDGCYIQSATADVLIEEDTEQRLDVELKALPEPACQVAVDVVGTGGGRVLLDPPPAQPAVCGRCAAGQDCDRTQSCKFHYPLGKTVELRAVPDASSYFSNWVDSCSGRGACQITIGAGTSRLRANFTPPPVCSGGNWCWEHPLPWAGTMTRLWGSSASDVWAVGHSGTIFRWDGATWKQSFNGTNSNLYGLWGSGPADIWAVGDAGALLRWNGSVWRPVVGGEGFDLAAVWGSGPDDVWAAGAISTPREPDGSSHGDGIVAILHWDGVKWSPRSPGIMAGTRGAIRALWGSGPDDVWAVGGFAYADGGVVFHWDGAKWTAQGGMPLPCLNDVWGRGKDDVWIVGRQGTLLHWDGIGLDGGAGAVNDPWLTSVWGRGKDDLWATTYQGEILKSQPGRQWLSVSKGAWALNALWGNDRGDVWAVGDRGSSLKWDGRDWKPLAEGRPAGLLTLSGTGPNDLWAAGVGGDALHWDGVSWQQVSTNTSETIYGIWGNAPDDYWAVGSAGTILRWNGQQWARVESGASGLLLSVWGSDATDVWVVGEKGTILRWDGQRWTPFESGVSEQLSSVWGNGRANAWAVGEDSVILRWNGNAWTLVSRGPLAGTQRGHLNSVWSSGSDDAWVVGFYDDRSGDVRRWDGHRWTAVSTGAKGNYNKLNQIWGSGPNDVWVVGGGGLLLRAYNDVLRPIPSAIGSTTTLVGIWGSGPNDIWTIGEGGAVLRYRP